MRRCLATPLRSPRRCSRWPPTVRSLAGLWQQHALEIDEHRDVAICHATKDSQMMTTTTATVACLTAASSYSAGGVTLMVGAAGVVGAASLAIFSGGAALAVLPFLFCF